MSETPRFAKGGVVHGPSTTLLGLLADDECLIGRDSRCRRTDAHHYQSADKPTWWRCDAPIREEDEG